MNETFRDVKQGDRLSAAELNELFDTVERLDSESPQAGEQRMSIRGVNGKAVAVREMLMVRMVAIAVPQSSTLYTDAQSYQVDAAEETGSEAYNAVVQVWDDDLNKWADDPDARGVDVVIMDDQPGWKPLTIGDIIPVQWKRSAGCYVPLESRETSVVMVTNPTADGGGFYTGVTLVWVSETLSWVTKGACYVLDVGSGLNSVGGFSGSAP